MNCVYCNKSFYKVCNMSLIKLCICKTHFSNKILPPNRLEGYLFSLFFNIMYYEVVLILYLFLIKILIRLSFIKVY